MKTISNKQFYKQSIDEFGVSAQGVHWNSKYTQYKRFEIITKLIKKDIKNSTLIDVGCGFGEYYNYLNNNHKIPKKYIGVDCEIDMIEISQKRFPYLEFYKQNILYDDLINADYYLCSGALNILSLEQCKIFIQRCYEISNKGFIFNYLKNITFNDIKKHHIIDICKQFTDDIVIKEGYLDNDFTIFMVK
ncbi:MAG: class I SAM-dependent methyltransferase [Campylobacterota bacterium]|nr:class I SAM-dependent methyltransferase [Campylobacterota bacterium]